MKEPVKFDIKKSILKASSLKRKRWTFSSEGKEYSWTNKMERVGVIRQGVPYNLSST